MLECGKQRYSGCAPRFKDISAARGRLTTAAADKTVLEYIHQAFKGNPYRVRDLEK
jgi:hypothetical protein